MWDLSFCGVVMGWFGKLGTIWEVCGQGFDSGIELTKFAVGCRIVLYCILF